MSKVFSFRLDDNNPREAQAREVIEAWVEEGYSVRHMVVEALLNFSTKSQNQSDLGHFLDQLESMISKLERKTSNENNGEASLELSDSFKWAIKNSAKFGVHTNVTFQNQ